jgi:hypothetical protein
MRKIGREVVLRHGNFVVEKVWYPGWISGIGGTFTHGLSGERQTVVQRDTTEPSESSPEKDSHE